MRIGMAAGRRKRALGFCTMALVCGALGTVASRTTVAAATQPITRYPIAGSSLYGITRGSDGNLWFADFGNNQIHWITPTGTTGALTLPSTVQIYSGEITSGPRSDPNSVWLGVSENSNAAMVRVDVNLAKTNPSAAVTVFQIAFDSNCGFGPYPQGITTGPDGNIWFTTYSCSDFVDRMTPSGAVTARLPIGSANASPNYISTGPGDTLWFTEANGPASVGRVLLSKVDSDPTHAVNQFTVPNPNSCPDGVTTGPDGNMWFADNCLGEIGRLDISTKAIAEYPLALPNTFPQDIVTGPDGKLWFTEADSVGSMDPVTHATAEYPTTSPTYPSTRPYDIVAVPGSTGLWFTLQNTNEIGVVHVAAADAIALTVSGSAIPSMREGTFSGVVATFTDADRNKAASAYTATVTWPDRTTSQGTVARVSNGSFTVSASGPVSGFFQPPYIILVSIADADGTAGGAQDQVTVTDRPLTATGLSLALDASDSFNGVVATFKDPVANEPASDYSANIDWGDGNITSGTIASAGSTAGASRFTVSGSHTYSSPASSTPVTITVADSYENGPNGVAHSTMTDSS